jgi:hypothetical protein
VNRLGLPFRQVAPLLGACLLVLSSATGAAADWLITPYFGTAFGGDSPMLDLDLSTGNAKAIFGGSVALLSPQILGVEADFGLSPRFFESSARSGLVTDSTLTTFTGNVILAVPLSITHESLRPYVVAGAGLIHASISDALQFQPVDNNLSAVDFGGGAIGMVSRRAGFRFELRHFRSIYAQDRALQPGQAHLSFWRASVGVTLRY